MLKRSSLDSNSIDGDFEPRRMYRLLEFVACSTSSEGAKVFGFEGQSNFTTFAKETAFFGSCFLDAEHAIEDLRFVAVMVIVGNVGRTAVCLTGRFAIQM